MKHSVIISAMNFFACLAVIALHCNCGGSRTEEIVKSNCGWAVPWFFFSAGLLFVRSAFRHSPLELLRRKLSSLVVPYCMWALIGFVVAYVLGTVEEIDLLQIFGISVSHPVGNGPLWFVRKLIVLVPIALCMHIVAEKVSNRVKIRSSYELAFVLMYLPLWFALHGKILPFTSTLSFFVGCMVSRLWFGDVMAKMVARIIPGGGGGGGGGGAISCSVEKNVFAFSAFVYFWHVPFLGIVHHFFKKPMMSVVGLQGVFYLMMWICTVIFCFSISYLLCTKLPRVYRLLSGAR